MGKQPAAPPAATGREAARIARRDLVAYGAAVLERAGVGASDAQLIGAYLVEASMRGVNSHGIDVLPYYYRGFVQRHLNASATPRIVRERAALAVVDADNGLGHVAAHYAMGVAVEKAAEAGLAAVAVRNSNHFGMAGHWTMIAVRAGMVGFATTNGPRVMTPWGGRAVAICNNPFSWGIPARDELPLLLDMACTAEARGKLRLAVQRGEQIPDSWALGPDGAPTTDPAAALSGVMLPVAGPKGSGIAVVNEVLSSALAGASSLSAITTRTMSDSGVHVTWAVGHFFMVLDPSAFLPRDEFAQAVDDVIAELHATPTAAGHDRVFMPGERGFLRLRDSEKNGVPITADTLAKLTAFENECDIAFPGGLAGGDE